MGHPRFHGLASGWVVADGAKVHERNRLTLYLAAIAVIEPDECNPVVDFTHGLCVTAALTGCAEVDYHGWTVATGTARIESVWIGGLVVADNVVGIPSGRIVNPHSNKLSESVGAIGLHLHHCLSL